MPESNSTSCGSRENDLDPIRLREWLAERGLVRNVEKLKIRALGGGVSNIVLLIEGSGIRWVAKQALGKLRVKDDWRSDRSRIFREADAIRALRPVLGARSAPELVDVDHENFFLMMTAAPESSVMWKKPLLSGESDPAVARDAGTLLGRMITASQSNASFAARFGDRAVFDQLRIDPYYRTTARRAPDIANAIQDLIGDSWRIQNSLVHGDYSPKNMLISGGQVFLIDFEVIHWGDPAFDSGFLLNHLLLKALHQPRFRDAYLESANAFWNALSIALVSAETVDFERMTLRHLGALMRARIDGKSPVEYIRDERTREAVRKLSGRILLEARNVKEAFAVSEAASAQLD